LPSLSCDTACHPRSPLWRPTGLMRTGDNMVSAARPRTPPPPPGFSPPPSPLCARHRLSAGGRAGMSGGPQIQDRAGFRPAQISSGGLLPRPPLRVSASVGHCGGRKVRPSLPADGGGGCCFGLGWWVEASGRLRSDDGRRRGRGGECLSARAI
jgi:hypothetical protein